MEGTPGQDGASGIVTVLAFDAAEPDIALPATPPHCMTASYTAGPNEVATMQFQATAVSPTDPTGRILRGRAGVSVDGGAAFDTSATLHAASYQNTVLGYVAHISSARLVPLDEGADYVFGFSLGGDSVTGQVACTGTVIIARTP